MFDAGSYNDAGGYHYQWFHFAMRERMRERNGNTDNHLMWRGVVPADGRGRVLERWVTAVKADRSSAGRSREGHPQQGRRRPSTAAGWRRRHRRRRSSSPSRRRSAARPTQCNTMYPSYSFARHVAGGPLDGNMLKCQLKPIDPRDYAAPFDAADLHRLRRIFRTACAIGPSPG